MRDYRLSWLSFAMNDDAFFHVMLSHFAADSNLSQRRGDPIEAVRYRMVSTRIINKRLAARWDQLADGTLAAVAVLANYEVCPRIFN